MSNIKAVRSVGKAQTYDLEVAHPDHQYYLSNGMLTSNSHSVLYSMISFQTAYLKANFPLEFLAANLMSEVRSNQKQAKENILRIKDEIRALGVRIVPPDLNTSTTSYQIIDEKTLMTGLDSLKYMGSDSILEILEKRPFANFEEFVGGVDAKKVRAPTIQALAASGSLDGFGIDRKLMFYYASDYRKKLQVHLKKKNPAKFNYPWPEEIPWTICDTYALEEYYMGEGLAGTVLERYPGFFDKAFPFTRLVDRFPYVKTSDNEKEDRKGNTHNIGGDTGIAGIHGIITNVFSFKVKKEDSPILGQMMARMMVQDPWGNDLNVLVFPEGWESMQDRIGRELSGGKWKVEAGLAIYFRGAFQWEGGGMQTSFVMGDIIDCMGAPALPADLKSRKVSMPRGKKAKVEMEKVGKEELAEKLEEEMIEEGLSSIDEDDDGPDPFD